MHVLLAGTSSTVGYLAPTCSFFERGDLALTLVLLCLFLISSGLMTVLQTGNMTFYPDTCSKATAAFSVLSETIKAIQAIFQQPQRQRNDLVQLIVQLQGHEKEKLHLTAAHHLERIRQRNQQLQPQQSGDPRIGRLLQEGVQILQQKIHTCVEHINEVLEEIRCAILEEDEQKKNGGI